ncbi:hypothetical protein BZA05DRAFT_401993 [Tricharina praecox]|uniref:uncharacterized protein n=1 Tax=Tricharina praecox TaxID=43433 RepID=UPI00221FE365|nr:uncharacterized protein BZA05DRAFT_401993 [Tricharina praecox]KAI5849016.1 hypothetical protein BZA05DRAFT_401993 [Tricharina praecox]
MGPTTSYFAMPLEACNLQPAGLEPFSFFFLSFFLSFSSAMDTLHTYIHAYLHTTSVSAFCVWHRPRTLASLAGLEELTTAVVEEARSSQLAAFHRHLLA